MFIIPVWQPLASWNVDTPIGTKALTPMRVGDGRFVGAGIDAPPPCLSIKHHHVKMSMQYSAAISQAVHAGPI